MTMDVGLNLQVPDRAITKFFASNKLQRHRHHRMPKIESDTAIVPAKLEDLNDPELLCHFAIQPGYYDNSP
jgi:hypothetical protein